MENQVSRRHQETDLTFGRHEGEEDERKLEEMDKPASCYPQAAGSQGGQGGALNQAIAISAKHFPSSA
eukprot:833847-Amorphochlora_amoeboformis.AAC.2